MNIISSHKMYIISPSVTRAAVRGWFWVLGCSSDMSGCIHWDWYWYPGDCLRISATSEAILPWPSVAELRHRHRITSFWGSFCEPIFHAICEHYVFEDAMNVSSAGWYLNLCKVGYNIPYNWSPRCHSKMCETEFLTNIKCYFPLNQCWKCV